jgi:hypothetical protein
MLHHPNRRTGATTRAALSLATHLTTPGARQALAVCVTRDHARDLLVRIGEVLQGLDLMQHARYDTSRSELVFGLTGASVVFTTAGDLERRRGARYEEVVVDGELSGQEHVIAASMRARPAVIAPPAPTPAADVEGAFSRALEWTARGLAAAATTSGDVATKAYVDAQTLGFKGRATTLDAGYYYAPYVPTLTLTPGLKPAAKRRVLSSR